MVAFRAVSTVIAIAVSCAAMIGVASSGLARTAERAAPVTGADVVTIGGISPGSRVNVRKGPSTIFPPVGTIGYGTRVDVGTCIGGGSARWCKITAVDNSVSGFISGRFLVEGGGATDGGPDYWAVGGLMEGDVLKVRRDPSPNAPALATLREGEVVRNLECRNTGKATWCRIRSITGMDVTGWVARHYLREASGPGQSPGGGGSGASGPDFYVVSGLPGGRNLGLRTKPAANAAVLAELREGTRLRNLGCEWRGDTRWCRVRTTGDVSITGWVNGGYLREE